MNKNRVKLKLTRAVELGLRLGDRSDAAELRSVLDDLAQELGDDLTESGTGVDADVPDNGYVALNMNRDTHLRYSTLDALITDTDLDAKGIEAFWSDHEVFELGKNIAKPKLKVVWGDDDGD